MELQNYERPRLKVTTLLLLFMILISGCVSQTRSTTQPVPNSVVAVPPTPTVPPTLSTPTIMAVPTPTIMIAKPSLTKNDEYVIYKTVIESLYLAEGIELVVIKDQTETSLSRDETLESAMEYVQENVEVTIDLNTINDYKAKNQQRHKLDRLFPLTLDYVLVSETELKKILSANNNWDQFNSIYPNSSGFITFSRVGFNLQKDQALVYTGNQADKRIGQGFYILLTKNGEDWNIQSTVLAWIL